MLKKYNWQTHAQQKIQKKKSKKSWLRNAAFEGKAWKKC